MTPKKIGEMSMSKRVKEELLPRMRQRYMSRGREGKGRLLDELCEQWGYERKYAIKLMSGKVGWGGKVDSQIGRPPIYGHREAEVIKEIWKLSEQPCAKRLKVILAQWLPYYEKHQGKLDKPLKTKILQISPATLDRLLASQRVKHPKRLGGTKPGTLLKNQIPLRTDPWDVSRPGYLEADTVAHCGTSLSGDFVWSITYTDILSGWSANRATWNKAAAGVVDQTRVMEQNLPFTLLGFDCDNGSEFLNYHLMNYLSERKTPVTFTRSRPYHKNDNGHVEQKKWSRVRQLLGYERFANQSLVELINDIYENYLDPLHNFFLPSAKLVTKHREKSRYKRKHDIPQTPYSRLLKSRKLSPQKRKQLCEIKASLDPIELKLQLEQKLKVLFKRVAHSSRSTSSLHSQPV